MAKAKKPAPKNPAANKKTRKEPTRIIIEIVIRNEMAGHANKAATPDFVNAMEIDALTGERSFAYSFTKNNVKISRFMVDDMTLKSPPDTGDFKLLVNDPSTPQTVVVEVLVIQQAPGGSGSFTLTCDGQTVVNDAEIPMNGGEGRYFKQVNLPL